MKNKDFSIFIPNNSGFILNLNYLFSTLFNFIQIKKKKKLLNKYNYLSHIMTKSSWSAKTVQK